MKKNIHFLMFIMLTIFLMSCAPKPDESPMADAPGDDQLALQTLTEFLENLYNGNYDDAAQLYGGTYEIMVEHNPSIDASDHSTLLQNACAINGVQCLQVKSIVFDKKVSDTEFVYMVEFFNSNETLFILGPCCGGNETDFPPQSVFYFTVMKVDQGSFIVMDMPPYVP
jgi:hypothetical protein